MIAHQIWLAPSQQTLHLRRAVWDNPPVLRR